ncbi:MAG: TetR/AcrR family transcriptional regulator [Chloroflexota bacterium]
MPKRTAAHAEAMREQILEGGRRAFNAGGFRGTSVPAIAAEAGVSVGLIYRYFPSKEELFLELCISGTPDELEELAAAIAPIADPVERLTVAIDSYFDALVHAIGAPLVLQALAAADSDERIRTALRRRGDDLRGFAARFVRDAIARGELDPATDVNEVAAATTMLLDGALIAFAEQGATLDRVAVRDRIVRTVAAASGLHATAPATPTADYPVGGGPGRILRPR